MPIQERTFGRLPTGETARLFKLKNQNGLSAEITDYGGIIVSLRVPDRNGQFADIVLGKDSLDEYLEGHPHFGPITGRVAGRIGGGRFKIGDREYILSRNNGPNCLHGGLEGFDKMLWHAKIIENDGIEQLQLRLIDPDGHNNFPGTVECTVSYALLPDNSLCIDYRASTNKTTPLNLTNHSYFNLGGHDSGDILDHTVQIIADSVATTDEEGTLLGKKDALQPGYNDFREPTSLSDLKQLDSGNADIQFNHPEGRTAEPKKIAHLTHPASGRSMEVLTTEPGVQFYAGLYISSEGAEIGKGECSYPPKGGLCFETQDYADSVNYPEMGGAILKPDQTFESTTIYKFSAQH